MNGPDATPGDSIDDADELRLLRRGEVHYPNSPDEAELETFMNAYPQRDYVIQFACPEFTSLCPITGQPDFARIDIEYIADQRCIESKSLKFYLFSFRNHGSFGEQIVNRILDDLIQSCSPRWARVIGSFTPRGGIGLKVVAEHPSRLPHLTKES